MKFVPALLALTIPLFAQVTPSPKSLAFTMRQGQPFPNVSTRYPANQQLTLSGSGAWTATLSGALASACAGPCFSVTPASGNGPATLTISFIARGAEALNSGSYSGSINFGSATAAVSLRVNPRFAYDQFVYEPGYPSNCRNTATLFPHTDTCALPDELPGAPSLNLLGPGSSLRDPNFGFNVTRLTAPKYLNQYSTVTAFSATAKYVITARPDGFIDIWDRASGSLAFQNISNGLNINYAAWDPSNDDRIWYFEGPALKYRLLSTSQVVTAANYSAPGPSRPAFSTLSTGGTADITDDNWWVFAASSYLCAVNLNNLSPANQESQTYCANTDSLNLTYSDFAQITQIDSESRKRYVTLMAQPANHLFSVGSSSLTYEGPIPTGPSDVGATAHSTVGQDTEGRQILFWNYNEIYGSKSFLAAVFLNRGRNMTRPVEEGGGLRLLYPSDPNNYFTDAHFGCTWRGVCVFTPYATTNGVQANNITAINSTADACEITTRAPHGFATGAAVLISAVEGVSGINGLATVTVTGDNTFTLGTGACAGQYVADSGNVVPNVRTSPDAPNRDEIVIARPGHEVRRIARHRSKPWDNGVNLIGYYSTPRSSLSRDGRYVAFASNAGMPEWASIWIVDTGVTAATRIRTNSVTVTNNSATLAYTVPAGEPSALITAGTNPNLTDNVSTRVYDGQTATSRQLTLTNLQPNAKHYYRITTGRFSFTGTFTTGTNSRK